MKIYCDMDGVLTDFDGHFKDLFGKDPRSLSAADLWSHVDSKPREFWFDMPWKADGKRLWKYLNSNYNDVVILSSPSRHKMSRLGKKHWVKTHLGSVTLILETNKHRYADSESILIDDTKKKIDAWQSAGGVGILHKSTANTIAKLKDRVTVAEVNDILRACDKGLIEESILVTG